MNPNDPMSTHAAVPAQPSQGAPGFDQGALSSQPFPGPGNLPGGAEPAVPQLTTPSQQQVQAMTPSGAPVSAALTTPGVAADNDKIESEWVAKVKEIVSATQHDPYQQNRQLAAVKADYMKKRYNKTVKLSE